MIPTDKQRVELVFLPIALVDVLYNGVSDTENPEFGRAKNLLWLSVRQAVMDLEGRHSAKILRRADRTFKAVMDVYRREGTSAAKVGLLVFYIVQAAAECDYLVLGPESPFSQAMDIILPALQDASEIGPLNASAIRGSRKALDALHQMGLFQGVEIAE